MLTHKPKTKTERLKMFVAYFLRGLSTYQNQKTQQDDISITSTPTNLNPPALRTVSEIPQAVHLVLQINVGNLTIPFPAKQQFSTTQ